MKNRKEFQELNRMAYPILLHYLLTSLFEILDQAIVGHYSVRGFAVVGIAASVVYGVTGALGMLSSAFHIIAAEKIGKQDERGFENAFAGSKILVILIGLTVVLVSILFGKPFFYAVYRQQGKELQELLGYFYPASFTVLQNMLIFQYSVYFKNRQNTKITLWVTVVSTTVNLFFDFVLVYGAAGFPRLGTAGAAWGSILGLGLSDYLLERTAKEKNDQGRRDPGIDIQDMENLSVFTGTGIAGKYNLCIYGSGSGGKIRSRRCGCL